MTFIQKLYNLIETNDSFLCIGLDADFTKIPNHLKNYQLQN